MRTKSIICSLIAAVAFAGIQQAQASDKEKYLVGGLLGGWILNEVFDRSSVEVHSSRPVVVERHSYPRHDHRPSGGYEYRNVKIWVPAYREQTVMRCGRVETRWIPGHCVVRREKVWVAYERDYSESYCRTRHSWHYVERTLESVQNGCARVHVNWMRRQVSVVNITAVT